MVKSKVLGISKQILIDTIILPTLIDLLPYKKLNPDETTLLFGPNGVLDSLSFVSFVIEIEFRFEETYQQTLRLITPLTLSKTQSPFESVEKLADFILEISQDKT